MENNLSDNFKIIIAEAKDWESYKNIRLESLQNEPQAYSSNLAKELAYSSEKWISRLQPYSIDFKSMNLLLIDLSNNKIVGTVGFYSMEEGIAEIVGLYVNKSFRDKHLGYTLMGFIIDQIGLTNDYKEIRLSVNEKQFTALSLYKKLGFNITDKSDTTLGDGNVYPTCSMLLEIV